MIGCLPKRVEPHNFEPCLSLFLRLAETNDITPGELASIVGISWADIKNGRHNAIRCTAELTGVSCRNLRKTTPRLCAPRQYHWHGALLSDRLFRPSVIYACPRCVEDDFTLGSGQPWIRPEWLCASYRACSIHGVELLEVGPVNEFRSRRLSHLVRNALTLPRPIPAARTIDSRFEAYLKCRIRGERPRKELWIDRLPLPTVIEGVERFGAFFVNPQYDAKKLSPSAWQVFAQAGFRAMSQDREAFKRMLQNHIANAIKPTAFGYRNLFGPAYAWLNSRRNHSDYSEFVDVLRELAGQLLRNRHQVTFLGEALPPIEGCSVIGLAEQYDTTKCIVRKALSISMVEPKRSVATIWGSVALYPNNEAMAAVRNWLDRIPGKEAQELLGVSEPTFKGLVRSKFIKPIRHPSIRRARYSKTAIKQLLDRLRSLDCADSSEIGPNGATFEIDQLESIGSTARRVPCHLAEILDLLLKGELRRVKVAEGQRGLAAINVDATEIQSKLYLPDPEGISEQEVAMKLKQSVNTVRALRKAGYLTCGKVRDPKTRKVVRRYAPESIRAFHREYICLAELVERHGISRRRMVTRLKCLGQVPDIAVNHAPKFYKRRLIAQITERFEYD